MERLKTAKTTKTRSPQGRKSSWSLALPITTPELEQQKWALEEVDALMGRRRKKKRDKTNDTNVMNDTSAVQHDVHKEPTAMTAEQIAAVVQ